MEEPMKLATSLTVLCLALSAPLRAAEDPPTPSAVDISPALPARTEVTIDRRDAFVGGLGFGGPLGASAMVGLLHGLGADVADDSERVKAVCAAPIPHCAHGFLLEADAGSGGGKLSLGLGARARVESEDFHGAVGVDLKLSVARTWGSPVGTEPDLTYLGPEVDFSIKHVGVNLGVLWRVSGHVGSTALFSWGLGARL
jgi:hypothetical protein